MIININWKKAKIEKIKWAIDFIKPLVVIKKVSLSDAAKRWETQNKLIGKMPREPMEEWQ